MQVPAVSQIFSAVLSPRPTRRGFSAFAPGSALISALVFTVIIALALAGMGTLTVSHYNLASTQSASEEALDLAEAGINWELHKITNNGIGSADYGGTSYNASDKISPSLQGTFTVTCATLDGSALTANTKQFTISCTASIRTASVGHPAQRTVRINAQPFYTFYTLYTTSSTSFTDNGIIVDGVSGSNGSQNIASGLTVKPKVTNLVFNGTRSPSGSDYDGYNMVSNPMPLNMRKTTDYVNEAFPSGGENYLREHNDNNLAVLYDPDNPSSSQQAISSDNHAMNTTGHQTVTLHGTGIKDSSGNYKPANYYLGDINMQDQSNLIFDNTNGPINIYYLRNSGGGSFMRGGHALKSPNTDSQTQVKMFMSAVGGINIAAADPLPGVANSTEINLGIYNYDSYVVTKKGKPVTVKTGYVNLGNNVNYKGQIIADTINIGANVNVTGQKGYFDTPTEYYGFSGAWSELNGAGSVGGANQ